MELSDYILAVLSRGGGASYTPVQLQKLFFILDRNLGSKLGGPYFNFQPYHYGPFDQRVYATMSDLMQQGMVDMDGGGGARSYRLTVKGQDLGNAMFRELNPHFHEYVTKVDTFVRGLGFKELVAAIYKAYPDMKDKSIFRF